MPTADIVFECSYEVCNKVGGIYTVIKSKAARMTGHYGEGYYTIGFYQPDKARVEFETQEPPKDVKKAFDELEDEGIKCIYGIWLIPGRPKTILVDAKGHLEKINDVKKWLWEDYGVDSLRSSDWFDHPVNWSYCVGKLIERLSATKQFNGKRIVGHFHEWMSGAGLLYLKKQGSDVKSVFTTHATLLGRTIAGHGEDLYGLVNRGLEAGESADPELARSHGVEDKHTMEVACAGQCEVFTTVSAITGKEAAFLLGRRPDAYLYNGVDCSRYPELEELSILRRKYRHEMRHFLMSYFNRYYTLDYSKIRSVFISGRYEFHNKGIDVFIDALGRLNEHLKEDGIENILLAFIFVPAASRGENFEVLKNVSLFEELYDHVDDYLPEMRAAIIRKLTEGNLPEDVFSESFIEQSRKMIAHFKEKEGGSPPLSAFQLNDEGGDSIMNALKRNGLLNRSEDRVKAIFYPAYLSSADRMIGLEYNEATLTCDMGCFPSFYEPWGYTPLECAAQATPSITTDLAGYGQFMKGKGDGVRVLEVEGKKYGEIVEGLYKEFLELVGMPKKQLTKRRISAKELSFEADWKALSENYVKAHDLAFEGK